MRRRVFRILFLLLIFPMFFKGVKAEEYSDKFIVTKTSVVCVFIVC